METHEIHKERGRDIVVRKKTPTSPTKKPPQVQTQQKKSLFGYFSSPPKGSKSLPAKTAQKTSNHTKEEATAPPAALESPIKEEGSSRQDGSTDKTARPQKLLLKIKKVHKVQVAKKKSKGARKDTQANSPLSSPTKIEANSPLPSPTKVEADASLSSSSRVDIYSKAASKLPTKFFIS